LNFRNTKFFIKGKLTSNNDKESQGQEGHNEEGDNQEHEEHPARVLLLPLEQLLRLLDEVRKYVEEEYEKEELLDDKLKAAKEAPLLACVLILLLAIFLIAAVILFHPLLPNSEIA
jgi:hypothetical protein